MSSYLLYRRPSYVSSLDASTLSAASSEWSVQKPAGDSSSARLPRGVPPGLSFDKILSGKTVKPCTLRDFMNYLQYIEHSAENLQFFLWYRDYMMRFSKLPSSEKVLSPLWLNDKPDADIHKGPGAQVTEKDDRSSEEITPGALPNFDMTLEKEEPEEKESPRLDSRATGTNQWDSDSSTDASFKKGDFRQVASGAFENHNIVAPFTIQPYREEVTRIIATYVAEGSPRELNISSKERVNLLQALATTTHPSAFSRVAASVETTLRQQSHPNFVRFNARNADHYRITFCTWLGVTVTSLGLLFALLVTLSGIPRGWRAFSTILFTLGLAIFGLGLRGNCLVLNVLNRCHVQPWELFDEEPDDVSVYGNASVKANSFDSFGSSNSYEDQPWVSKYEKLSVIRRIFSRETRVNEDALRKLHNTMLVQSLISGFLGALVLEAIFLSVPGGHFL